MKSRLLLVAIAASQLLAARAVAQVSVNAAGDHMAIGQTHYTGFSLGAGWHGAEVTYRHAEGQDTTADGAAGDLYLRWHNYFLTGGATAFDIRTLKTQGWEIAPRVGAGLQFGPLRAAVRYERFNHGDGLTMTLGVTIPVGGW